MQISRTQGLLARRSFLRIGLAGGVGVSLSGAVGQTRAWAGTAARARSVILVYAGGGISHHDSFDPRPDAPAEVRGEFGTIETSVPGVWFSEYVPELASGLHRFSLIRSVCHAERDHGVSAYYMQRGYRQPNPTFDRPENQHRAHPNIGSHVARLRGSTNGLPPYLCIPGLSYLAQVHYYTAGWMGRAYDPFLLKSDPGKDDFQVRALVPPSDVSAQRVAGRVSLIRHLDQANGLDRNAAPLRSMNGHYERVYEMIGADAGRRAFDLSREPDSLRDAYGRNSHGQSCLLARRVVEAGVPFVAVDDFDWDHHAKMYPSLRRQLPEMDRGVAALISDLDERGLLDSTLVLLLTDFGRTPQINPSAGRDHWPNVFSILAAGAGIPGGLVIGASDRLGAEPAERPITPKDLAATIYGMLDIDPFQPYNTPDGRELQVLDEGEFIREWA